MKLEFTTKHPCIPKICTYTLRFAHTRYVYNLLDGQCQGRRTGKARKGARILRKWAYFEKSQKMQ